jgi:outer membrane protein
MKRSFALFAIFALALTYSAVAQLPASPGLSPDSAPAAAAPAGPAKIAVIAFQIAVAQTNEGQRDFGDLQKKYAPQQTSLKTLSDEVDSLTKQLQTQGATLSEAERASRATEDARNNFQQDIQGVYNGLASKVYDSMQSLAEQQGWTLILDISAQQTPVLYASEGTNITKQVIDAYNVKSGVPPPPAQGADAPKPKPVTPASKPAAAAPKTPSSH